MKSLPVFLFLCLFWCHTNAQQKRYQFPLKDLIVQDPVHLEWVPETGPQKQHLVFRSDTNQSFCFLPGVEDGFGWDTARYLIVETEHNNAFSTILHFEFFRNIADKNPIVRFKTGVLPGLRTQVVFPLSYLSVQSIYIPKYPRQLKGTVEGTFLQKSEVARVRISVSPVQFPHFQPHINIYSIYLSDELPAALPSPEKPVVDSLGQWASKSWPEKIAEPSQLNRLIRKQMKQTNPRNDLNNLFLGNPDLVFPGTGFFRTHFDGTRWWLVDPDGHAFLSSGIDCIRSYSSGPVDGIEDLISWLPFRKPEFKDHFIMARKHIQFNFFGANLERALGPTWQNQWYSFAKSFLLDHGFNTVGNWSDLEFCQNSRLPWVYPMHGFPQTKTKVFRDFPDVFDPSYEDSVRKFALQLAPFKKDPFLIGYFLSNEPEWAFGAHNLAAEMLANPWPGFTRKALIRWLKDRHSGNITQLNSQWSENFASFETLDSGSIRIESLKARAELQLFTEILVDSLIGKVCRAVKKVDPNHLNLGLRYAWISSDLCYRAGHYFDVFSLNGYGMKAPSQTSIVLKKLNKPVLIGEFHIGTLDKGLPASGIAAALNTEERGWAIRNYMEEAFSRPEIVGVHYFQLLDQPVTGRFDGENYQIGFLDICNQPYKSVLEDVKKANKRMYKIARRKSKPVYRKVQPVLPIYY